MNVMSQPGFSRLVTVTDEGVFIEPVSLRIDELHIHVIGESGVGYCGLNEDLTPNWNVRVPLLTGAHLKSEVGYDVKKSPGFYLIANDGAECDVVVMEYRR